MFLKLWLHILIKGPLSTNGVGILKERGLVDSEIEWIVQGVYYGNTTQQLMRPAHVSLQTLDAAAVAIMAVNLNK